MKSGFFRKVFVLYAIVFLLAVLFADRYIAGVVRDSYIRTLEDSLATQARLIVPQSDFTGLPLDSRALGLKDITGARVTFIARSGLVIGDSDADSSIMENHADRPEVQQALIQGTGQSIRFSDTIRENLLYTAVAVRDGNKVAGIVRLAVPLTEVSASITALRARLFTGVSLVLVITGLVSLWQIRRVRNLVRDVTGFSSAIAGGKLGERLMLKGLGEFDEIAGNLNAMAEELHALIAGDREKYEQLDIILRNVPDVLIMLDDHDRIMLMNRAAEEFFSTSVKPGRPIREVLRNPAFITLLNNARGAGRTSEVELEPEDVRGRYYKAKASPVEIAGKEEAGMVVMLHDITDSRNLEEVRKDFVANVSHELKTPITAIKGFADTLLQGAIDDKENASKFIGIIRANSERIIKLVDDLMTLSRIELGVIKLEMKETDLLDAIRSTVENFQLIADRKGISLKADTGARPVMAMADGDRVVQILSNLVDNALKYTDKGSVTVGAEDCNGRMSIFVSDTGTGIPEKHIPRLGERFYRADPSRSRELGGTGLGLAIVKHLVSAHGWRMDIESRAGMGTTVRMIL